MDSRELLRHLVAARPDDPLWEELFQRCLALIRTTFWWRISRERRNAPPLEDMGQEVMERLLARGRQGLARFQGDSEETFDGYIRRITLNILFDGIRHEVNRRQFEELLPFDDLRRLDDLLVDASSVDGSASPETGVHLREMGEIVEKTLREMSLDARQRGMNRLLFRLYFLDSCSIPQIARLRAVTLSASSVGRRIRNMRSALQRAFQHRRRPSPTGQLVRREPIAERKRR